MQVFESGRTSFLVYNLVMKAMKQKNWNEMRQLNSYFLYLYIYQK